MGIDASADDRSSDRDLEFFEKHVRPVLVTRCYSCHSAQANKRKGGLHLDSRAGWKRGGDSGAVIVPNDPDASLLIQAIRYSDDATKMPPDKALSAKEVTALEKWVAMGAPDPRDKAATKSDSTVDPADPVAGRQHWAFRPLSSVERPDVKQADWARSPIDSFVLARLEAEGMTPAADADRRTLARRLYFQLIGLPPTPEQLSSFLADERPDAVEKLVDELLASPHFGERWGRHWLDLARYADSNGLDENFLFREAWRYRNWVIDAVNGDVPLDRFLLEQIAGDLLPYDSVEQRDQQRIAAGFMVIGPKVLLGNDARERRLDVADEQLDTIGRTVLGLTLGCARCHDHKFDPIPTADYYAMAGILTSTEVMETRYMLGQQRTMERLVGIGKDGESVDDEYENYWRQKKQREERHAKAEEALDLLKKGDAAALLKLLAKHKDAVATMAADDKLPQDARIKAQELLVNETEAAAKPRPIPPRAMIPADAKKPADEAIRIAGQFDHPGDTVARGVLQVVSEHQPTIPDEQSGRLQLAHWLTDVENGAGRVAARVFANRIWHHLIGRGIVRTVDNFGRTGEPPSHPELLDYMAKQLIDDGWSVKKLVRRIVLSRTFAMGSQHNASFHETDPENRLLWRAHRRRLDPESLRDAMMSVAGTLKPEPMDSTVSYLGDQATAVGPNKNRRRTDFPCRTVYLPVIRNDLPEILDVFDFANPHTTTGMRPQTMVATQGLFILNDKSIMDAARSTADRLSTNAEEDSSDRFVIQLFELLTCRIPDDEELQQMVLFIAETERQLAADGDKEAKINSRAIACHALFASGRFQILE